MLANVQQIESILVQKLILNKPVDQGVKTTRSERSGHLQWHGVPLGSGVNALLKPADKTLPNSQVALADGTQLVHVLHLLGLHLKHSACLSIIDNSA